MGLGKTIQSITFLSEIFLRGIHGPFLIIAPLSTITNWEREFRTWTEMNAIVYHGSQISRQMIQQYEMVYRDAQVSLVRFRGSLLPGQDWYPSPWAPGDDKYRIVEHAFQTLRVMPAAFFFRHRSVALLVSI